MPDKRSSELVRDDEPVQQHQFENTDEPRDRVHHRATGIVNEHLGSRGQGTEGSTTADPVHQRAVGIVDDQLGDAADGNSSKPARDVAAYATDNGRTAAQTTTAKPASRPSPPVDTETSRTYRHVRDFEIHIGSVPAKVQLRLEASAKDKGNVQTTLGEQGKVGSISWGASQNLIEQSTQGVDLKVSSALMKANLDLLADAQLPGPLAFLPTPKIEVKGFEAGLSLKEGAQLKLMTIAMFVEGDFSSWFPESLQAIANFKLSVRMEWALAPDVAKKMIELARSADAIERSAAVEAKIAKNEKWLAYYKKRGVKDQVKKLEGELSKLRKVRGAVAKARDAAIEKVAKIGLELEKSAMGRLLKKASAKALSVVFKKFLPIYNVISTMQDVYEVGSWLAGLDWGSIGERIVEDGEGGTALSDGSHDSDDDPGGGDGFGEGGRDTATDVNPDAIERELKQEATPELHATAKAVMGLLEKKGGTGPSVQLLNEDKATLNAVIPEDLTAAEIEAMKGKITNARESHRDLVESVIEAIQEVRPFGEHRLGPQVAAPETGHGAKQGGVGMTKPQRDEPAKPEHKKAKKLEPKSREQAPNNRVPSTWIIDPADTLRHVITIDETTRRAVVPDEVEFPGFTARVVVIGVAQRSWDSGDAGQETSFMVKVSITPISDVPAGVTLVGGRPIERDVELRDIIVDGIGLRPAQRR